MFENGQFYGFFGVVEDRHDPLKLGRVRVRIHGIHTDLKIQDDETGEGIPTDKLPWAHPLNGLSASMSGVGQSPLGLVEGTWVFGFARDGEAYQDLVILGTLGGIPQDGPNQSGFNDPNGAYPRTDYLQEPDTNRLARNENIDKTIVQTKNDEVVEGIDIALGGTWSQPESPYAAEYPFNHVRESESGHIEEWDDTEGAERLHRYHKSGTFEEIHPDGTIVRRIKGENYEVYEKNNRLYIMGDLDVTVDGANSLKVQGDIKIEIEGNATIDVAGSTVVNSPTTTVNGDVTTNGDVKLDGGGGQIVTTLHVCAFTGSPHPAGSSTCEAKL